MIDYTITQEHEAYKNNRALKYSRQRQSAKIAKMYTAHKVGTCMYTIAGAVKINYSQDKRRAFYSGLATCGSVWDCPICSAKVSARRGEEINQWVNNWLQTGGAVVMVTYTMRHNISDRLDLLSRALTQSIRFVHSGAPWARIKDKFGIKGSITATEVLYNEINGWHIHKHQILFLEHSQIDIKEMQRWIYERYERSLEQYGYNSNDDVGVKVSDVVNTASDLPGYITKWGIEKELTALDYKEGKGLTPFELLDNSDNDSIFAEYSRTMYGKRRLVWSKGLRLLLGLGVELTDEELAEEQELKLKDIVEIREIPTQEWIYIRTHNLRCEVLEYAEQGEDKFQTWYRENILFKCYVL